jgi:hypothetical protein
MWYIPYNVNSDSVQNLGEGRCRVTHIPDPPNRQMVRIPIYMTFDYGYGSHSYIASQITCKSN